MPLKTKLISQFIAGAARRRRRGFAVIGALLAASACVGVPRPELAIYVGAFAAAEDAGLLVYDRVEEAILSREAADVDFPETLGAALPKVRGCDGRYTRASVLERCRAISAIAAYNEALVMLASGASGAAVEGAVADAFADASALAALTGAGGAALGMAQPAADALSALLAEVLDLRDGVVIAARLRAGRPHVIALIAALREDAPRIYTLRRDYAAARLNIEKTALFNALNPILAAASGRSAPTGAEGRVAFAEVRRRVDAALAPAEPAFTGVKTMADVIDPDGAALSAAAASQMLAALGRVEAGRRAFDAEAANWRPFAEAVAAYDAMLAESDAALRALTAAADDPFSPGGGADRASAALASLRARAEDVRRAFADIR